MRTARLIPLALLSLLLCAPAVLAADHAVSAPDFDFAPRNLTIEPGDTVTWNFEGPTEHTSSSNPGQVEKWESGLKAAGTSFSHTFTKPGKFQYFCQPHADFMKGTVTVGSDSVAKSFTKVKLKGSARSIKATVTLKEAAKVTFSVKGPKRKKVTKRLKKGKRSLTIRKLSKGSYKTKVVAQDDFDKKTTKKGKTSVG
ncbi:MAG TPA: plastocyanin/azurin family copper-binding protein [Thermoleophilaceae bacterium]|nr:plastocyanin/azurin family copper-binding protein [Thermoleophilaceae bacterium]